MKYQTRYQLMNGGVLVLFRKRFGIIWTRYSNFDNQLRNSEKKMNDLVAKFEKEATNHRNLLAQRNQIKRQISENVDDRKGWGPVEVKSLPMFPSAISTVGPQPDLWKKFMQVLKGGKSIAETVAGDSDMTVLEVNSSADAGHVTSTTSLESIGSTSHAIRPAKSNNSNNRKQRGGDNRNN